MNKQQIKKILEEEGDLDKAIEQILALDGVKISNNLFTMSYGGNPINIGDKYYFCYKQDLNYTITPIISRGNKISKVHILNKNCVYFKTKQEFYDYRDKLLGVTKDIILPTYKILCYSQASNRLSHSLTKRDDSWDIHEVERLSDGVRFKLGDKVQHIYSTEDTGIITSFRVDNANLIVEFQGFYKDDNNFNFCNDIKILKILKTPLFKTEDGVDIYEGNFIQALNFKKWILTDHKTKIDRFCKQDGAKNLGYLWFSSEQAAEDYIILNKPVLCINDLIKAGIVNGYQDNQLKQLVKSKL